MLTTRAQFLICKLNNWSSWTRMVSANRREDYIKVTLDHGSVLPIALTTKPWRARGFAVSWIEKAGITTPFTIPQFPFIQAVSQRTLDNINPAFTLANGPSVAPIPAIPDAGLGQGVFTVDRDLGSGDA